MSSSHVSRWKGPQANQPKTSRGKTNGGTANGAEPRPNFLCLWIQNFPAWALAQSDPALKLWDRSARPFIVCEKGYVVASSFTAFDAGVRVGMTTGRAQSACAQVLVVPRDRNREELAWAEVQRAMYGLTPQIESIEPGLLFAGVDARKAYPLIAHWNASGGQAFDRASAYLAAITSPRREIRCLRQGGERIFTDRVPLEALQVECIGVGGLSSASVERLNWFGWTTVGALRVLSRRQLEEQLGAQGEWAFQLVQGPRCEANLCPVATWIPPEELTARLEFEVAAREPAHWEGALDELLRQVCSRLGSRSGQSLEIIAQTPIAPVSSRRVLKEPISYARELERPARSALLTALGSLAPLPPVITGLEVRLGHLVAHAEQASLFEGEKDEKALRPNRLKNALERVEARFAGRTGRYVSQDPDSPFPEEAHGWLPALEQIARQKMAAAKQRSVPPPKESSEKTGVPEKVVG